MEQQFAHEYKLVLERSRDEAIRHHCNKIEPIHIFLALTHDSNSKPYKLIEALGNVPIDQLRSDIDTIAHSLSDNEIATTSIVASPLSERIIKLSALEARMLKSDVVNTEHLLLALFHNSEIQNMDFFKKMIVIWELILILNILLKKAVFPLWEHLLGIDTPSIPNHLQ